MLKLIRKIEPGIHPAREVEEFLTEAGFANIPPALGAVEYSSDPEQPGMTLTVLSGYKRNVVNAWTHTVDHLGLFFERALATPRDDARFRELATTAPLMLSKQQMPALMAELLGGFAENARLLGRRTAEMHLALASRPDLPDFAPEPFTDFYRQGLYHGMLGQLSRSLDTLRSRLPRLPEAVHEPARRLLERESQLAARLHPLRDQRIPAMRIRQHGDYHLGQVLFAGNDFIIIDFEGDPNRPVSERRIKRSPLRDVASMIRSFHYVAHAALYGQVPGIVPRPEAVPQLEQWADGWYRWVSAVFLDEYMHVVRASDLLPHNDDALRTLFTAYMIQKALIEIEYEIEHRPDWLRIPVVGILALLEEHE
jgi:maltose alpha-D-glucosyltransferase/alpha-amylase